MITVSVLCWPWMGITCLSQVVSCWIPYAPLLLLPVLCRFQAEGPSPGPLLVWSGSPGYDVVHVLPIIFGSHGATLLCCPLLHLCWFTWTQQLAN